MSDSPLPKRRKLSSEGSYQPTDGRPEPFNFNDRVYVLDDQIPPLDLGEGDPPTSQRPGFLNSFRTTTPTTAIGTDPGGTDEDMDSDSCFRP